jgi:hypothetical protein
MVPTALQYYYVSNLLKDIAGGIHIYIYVQRSICAKGTKYPLLSILNSRDAFCFPVNMMRMCIAAVAVAVAFLFFLLISPSKRSK